MPDPSQQSSEINVLTPAALQALLPQFEILDFIGAGGMGAVYKARQPKLNRLVAIKIFHQELEQKYHLEERFELEAQTMARLNHPNIVTLYEYGEVPLELEFSMHYLVMEYVEGHDLKNLLKGGILDSQQTAAVLLQVCEAMCYAHEQKVIHRDIKPANIMIDGEGLVKVTDFGVAKLVDAPFPNPNLTQGNMVVGTLSYIAPEQAANDVNIDRRADIYSLGVILYEMLTGTLPKGAFQPPTKKSATIDARFDPIIHRSLQPDPDDRYQSISEFKEPLNEISIDPSANFAGRSVPPKTKGHIHLPALQLPAFSISARHLFFILAIITIFASLAFFIQHQSSPPTQNTPHQPLPALSGDEAIVRVFLLAGQANMGGRANISHLEKLINDPLTGSSYAHLINNEQWASRPDVWQHFHVLNREQGRNQRAYAQNEIIGPLKVGFGKQADVFGPDIQFGQVVGDALKERILIIKYAPGNASLAVSYQSQGVPTTKQYRTLERKSERFSDDEYGWAYQQMMRNFYHSLNRIPEILQDPDATRFEISGFIWLHGAADSQNIKMAEDYEDNLIKLIQSIRKDSGIPELPVIIGEFGPHGTEQVPRPVQLVRAAQKSVSERSEFKNNTLFIKTHDLMSTQEAHTGPLPLYFRRADIIIEIGDALGQAALKFISTPARDDSQSNQQVQEQFLKRYSPNPQP